MCITSESSLCVLHVILRKCTRGREDKRALQTLVMCVWRKNEVSLACVGIKVVKKKKKFIQIILGSNDFRSWKHTSLPTMQKPNIKYKK
jgi:hypothetical protein